MIGQNVTAMVQTAMYTVDTRTHLEQLGDNSNDVTVNMVDSCTVWVELEMGLQTSVLVTLIGNVSCGFVVA